MKKILSYLMVIALVLVQCTQVVNAASITINNSVNGQTYSAYKIFDVTKSGDNYAYSIDSTSEWFSVVQTYATNNTTAFTLTRVGSTTKYVVIPGANFASDENAKAFADYLNANKTGKTPAVEPVTATSTTTVLDGLDAGYYFVDSSLGALCILHTTTDELIVTEKNSEPTVVKTVSQSSASVGETITFTVKITAGGNADTSYVLHDKMTAGLTLDEDSFTIKVGNVIVDSTNYEIKTSGLTDGCTFEIVFKQDYTKTLAKDTEIVVTYNATVNENAITESKVENEAKVQYGNTYSQGSKVTVVNYDFDLVKTDGKETLSGAKFKLYDALTGGHEIELFAVTDGDGKVLYYRPVQANETAVAYIEAGSVSIKGLASGTYYLEEIEAPDGYNQLTQRVDVTLNGDLTLENKNAVEVVNTTGSLLPSTGGMGTVLFVVIGSIMVLGFGVLLVTKLRLSKMSI